jgi:hypothetical protein
LTSHAKSRQVAELEKQVSDALSLVTVAISFLREHDDDLEARTQIIENPGCTMEEDCPAEKHVMWCGSQQESPPEPPTESEGEAR